MRGHSRIPQYWVRHLRNPVRFSAGLRQLLQDMPDSILVEAGPGQGLCALARQNNAGPRTILPSTSKAQEPNADLALMLTGAGALWTRGVTPDWAALRNQARPRRVSLPTYAFDHQRHWIEPAIRPQQQQQERRDVTTASPGAAVTRLASYDDWFRVPEWTREPSPPANPQPGTKWLVFGNHSKLTSDIVSRVTQDGGSVTLVHWGQDFARKQDGSFRIAPSDAEHYVKLLAELERSASLPDHILHLWAMDTMPGGAGQQLAGQALAFDSLLNTAKAIQELDLAAPLRLTVVTAGQPGRHGRSGAAPRTRAGPRALPRDTPRDTERQHAPDRSGPLRCFVGVRRALHRLRSPSRGRSRPGRLSRRRALDATACPGPASRPAVSGSWFVRAAPISSPAGWATLRWTWPPSWRGNYKVRLALVSRRALPPKASWPGLAASGNHSEPVRLVRRLLALEQQGAQVLAISADVADREAMARVVSDCRARFGTINGVFHAAGVLDDGPIATRTADSVRRVISPKACGAQVLHELLPPGDLDVFAVFSSTSVYLGTPGQVDYVAANAFVDSLAASRPDGLAVHWGVWGDRGMAVRAYGRHSLGHEAPKEGHPLLGLQVDSENGAAFEATYSSGDLWVLREHAVAGRPVLPGTAYIEIARAAMAVLHPGAAVEIRSLSFEEAMVFDGTDGTHRSRGNAAHVRRLRFSGAQPRCAGRPLAGAREGERQRIPRRAASGGAGVVGAMAQGRDSAGESRRLRRALAQYRPDAAGRPQRHGRTGAARAVRRQTSAPTPPTRPSPTWQRPSAFTWSMRRSANRIFSCRSRWNASGSSRRCPRASSAASSSKAPGSRFAAFDVSLHTPEGSPIATFEGFSLRGVKPDAVSHQAAGAAASTASRTRCWPAASGEKTRTSCSPAYSRARAAASWFRPSISRRSGRR